MRFAQSNFYFQLVILFSLIAFQGSSQEILFGERNLDSNKTAFFIDNQGGIYPETHLSNQRIKAAGGTLVAFYQQHPSAFDSICKDYSIPTSDFDQRLENLQQAIIQQKLSSFIQPTDQSVTILVHGFGKTFDQVDGKTTSPTEYNYFAYNLNQNNLKTAHYIPIFWDSYYQCCFTLNRKGNKAIFELFEKAQENAIQVGFSVRKIMHQLSVPTINILGHSLGTKVIASSLFNIVPSTIPTPTQNVNIALIAPAMDGQACFQHYFDRVGTPPAKENYTLFIFYNPSDFVLRKKDNYLGIFGPGVNKYGRTSLGCDYKKDAVKTQQLIHAKAPNAPVFLEKVTTIKKQHSLIFYLQQNALLPFINSVENK